MPGLFHITEINHAYRFELISANGDIILHSEMYPTRSYCASAIQLLKENVGRAHCYEKMTKSNGQYFFVVKQQDSGVIATSELYWSDSSRDYAMMIVKREAPTAGIKK